MPLSLDQVTDAITKIGNFFLRKDGGNSATSNISMGGNKITNLANGSNPTDAVNVSQLEASQQAGTLRGNLIGAIKNVSGTPRFYYDTNADGVVDESLSAASGLYLCLESVVLGGTTYPANAIVRNTAGSWYMDSTNATLGTFDPTASYADLGGTWQNAKYQFLIENYSGHNLPNADTTGWTDGDRIEWNAAYDTSSDNNTGRWILSQNQTIADATNLIKGKVLLGDGLSNLTGQAVANIDTARGLSFSGSGSNRAYGLNVLTTFFEFVGGALGIKTGSITANELATNSVTTAKIADSNVTTAKIADSNVTTAKIADNNVTTAKVADDNITNAKLANMATQTFKGRNTASTGDPEDLSMPTARTMLNVADGSTKNIRYQTTRAVASNLTTSTANLTALTPLPTTAMSVEVDINGAQLTYGTDYTVNAGTGVITLIRSAIGYDVLTTYVINVKYDGVS